MQKSKKWLACHMSPDGYEHHLRVREELKAQRSRAEMAERQVRDLDKELSRLRIEAKEAERASGA